MRSSRKDIPYLVQTVKKFKKEEIQFCSVQYKLCYMLDIALVEVKNISLGLSIDFFEWNLIILIVKQKFSICNRSITRKHKSHYIHILDKFQENC